MTHSEAPSPEQPEDIEWLVTRLIGLRRVLNVVNLSTALGLLVGSAGGAHFARGPHGVLLAHDFKIEWLAKGAPAFTIGDVVLLRVGPEVLAARPRLLRHEARHSAQYAWCIGLGFLPLYFAAAGWSWLRLRNVALANVFERQAGLVDGGYVHAVSAPDAPGTQP